LQPRSWANLAPASTDHAPGGCRFATSVSAGESRRDLLDQPRVAVGIGERKERPVARASASPRPPRPSASANECCNVRSNAPWEPHLSASSRICGSNEHPTCCAQLNSRWKRSPAKSGTNIPTPCECFCANEPARPRRPLEAPNSGPAFQRAHRRPQIYWVRSLEMSQRRSALFGSST
jgi:hypothetical protein